jgi:hypothetical protein
MTTATGTTTVAGSIAPSTGAASMSADVW